MPIHHLMVGTWTPPGAIFTFAFDDEALTLKLVKRTEIPQDEPISWMTFNVRIISGKHSPMTTNPKSDSIAAQQNGNLRCRYEEMVLLRRQESHHHSASSLPSHAPRPYVEAQHWFQSSMTTQLQANKHALPPARQLLPPHPKPILAPFSSSPPASPRMASTATPSTPTPATAPSSRRRPPPVP